MVSAVTQINVTKHREHLSLPLLHEISLTNLQVNYNPCSPTDPYGAAESHWEPSRFAWYWCEKFNNAQNCGNEARSSRTYKQTL